MTEGSNRRARLHAILEMAPIIPVITIEQIEHAIPLARALVRGGLRAIEITLRTRVALAAGDAIRDQVPEMILGVGTVLTPDDLKAAVNIGAAFALSPGSTPELLDVAQAGSLPFIPGAQTASDVMGCVSRGFDVVKFFPAVPSGGISMLRALGAPFPNLRFCPTGGISEKDVPDWFAQPNVVAIGGSWIAPLACLAAGDWDEIETRARSASKFVSHGHRDAG